MKAQTIIPYDSAIVGINNVYSTVGNDSFFVNSACILVNKILTIAREYFIFNFSTVPGNKMSEALLVDCYFYEGVIHLILEDVRSHELYTISHCLECTGNDCPFVLMDLNYFKDLRDAKAIRDYCGCDEKMKVAGQYGIPKLNEDLLDFEF